MERQFQGMKTSGRLLLRAFAALAVLAVAGCEADGGGESGDGATAPNIVWIISDDQAFTDFGFMGHGVVQTPHLDALAAQSALFPHGYNPTSLCRSSLATMITGKYAFEHGICFNDPEEGMLRGIANQLLLMQRPAPDILAEAGYASFQSGKFWEGSYRNGGFTEGMTVGRRHGDFGLTIGRKGLDPIRDFVRRRKDGPFFLWYAPLLPHTPHNASSRYTTPFAGVGLHEATLRYYANILWFDETVGQLIDLMKEEGEYADTLFIFIVDNGWAPAESATERFVDPGDGRVLASHYKSKQSQYDTGVRTPVFLHWPGRIGPGVYEDLVSAVDLLPTSLAAAGVSPPEPLPGLNLLPRAKGGAPLDRDAVFGEIYRHTARKWDHPDTNLYFRWMREGDWKLILPETADQPIELYNIADDPMETFNHAADPRHAERIATMSARIDAWWRPQY